MDDPEETSEELAPLGPGYPKNIPVEKIIELHAKGLSQSQIAKLLGCHKSNIYYHLREHREDLQGLQPYMENTALVQAFHERRLLGSISHADIEKMDAYKRYVAYGIVYDKRRLQEGKATSLVGYGDMTRALTDVLRDMAELEKSLGIEPGAVPCLDTEAGPEPSPEPEPQAQGAEGTQAET